MRLKHKDIVIKCLCGEMVCFNYSDIKDIDFLVFQRCKCGRKYGARIVESLIIEYDVKEELPPPIKLRDPYKGLEHDARKELMK